MKQLAIIIMFLITFWLPSTGMAAKRTILVIPKGQQTLYWKILHNGANQAGNERQAEIIYRGPRTEDDYQSQAEIIKNGIHHKVNAIVIAPNHTTRAATLLKEAVRQGIKVIIIDSDMEFEERTSFVASDNRLAGRKAGKLLLSLMEGKGKVLLLKHQMNNASTLARETGFLESIKTSKATEVIDLGYMGTGIGNTYHRTLDALATTPDIDGVFASSEINTKGLIKALKESPSHQKVMAVGFDYTPDILYALEEGLIDGLIAQDPYQMGYLAITTACDALDGKPVKKRITIKTLVVTDPNDSRLRFPEQVR